MQIYHKKKITKLRRRASQVHFAKIHFGKIHFWKIRCLQRFPSHPIQLMAFEHLNLYSQKHLNQSVAVCAVPVNGKVDHLGHIWGIIWGHVWSSSGAYLGHVWGIIWGMSGSCLGHHLGHVQGHHLGHAWSIIWGMSGASSRTYLGHHLGHVWGIIWGIFGTTSGACLGHHLGHGWGKAETTSGAYCQQWTTTDNNPRCYMPLWCRFWSCWCLFVSS